MHKDQERNTDVQIRECKPGTSLVICFACSCLRWRCFSADLRQITTWQNQPTVACHSLDLPFGLAPPDQMNTTATAFFPVRESTMASNKEIMRVWYRLEGFRIPFGLTVGANLTLPVVVGGLI